MATTASTSRPLESVPGPLACGTCHEADILGSRTRYWQYGAGMNTGVFPRAGTHIILIHGFRGDHHGLEIIANRLLNKIPNVSIISPDVPGFGRSEALENRTGISEYVAWLHGLISHVSRPPNVANKITGLGQRLNLQASETLHPETLNRLVEKTIPGAKIPGLKLPKIMGEKMEWTREKLAGYKQEADTWYTKTLAPMVQDLSTSRIHLVGHSFGSIITAAYGATHPETLNRLSLINPISEPALDGAQRLTSRAAALYYRAGALLPEKLGFALLRSQTITRITSEIMMRTRDPAMRRFINGQHAAYFGSFSSRKAVLQAYQASISHTAAAYAGRISLPVQMIVAADDDLGTLESAEAMFAKLQARSPAYPARMDVIERVGHLIHYETPTRAAELIAEFGRDE